VSRDVYADAARRHAHAFPGHILLAAEPCGIPASSLTVDVLADQVEVLDASSKYALRALLNGVRTVEDLELFLGLSSGDTGLAVASLLVAEFIDYRAPTPGEPRRLELLPSGLEAAREASVRRPKATTIPVVYDRLARSITDWRKHDLIRSTDAKAEPRILLPPRGSGPVMVEDLDPGTISDALEHTARHDFRILGVSGVTENRNFFRDAVLLVFKDLDSETLRLGIEVGGEWSEVHAAALEELGAVERLGLSVEPLERPYQPVEDSGTRLSMDEVVAIQTAPEAHREHQGTGQDLLSRTAIRWLGVYEHPQWLEDALANSKRRLLIISPWIRRAVVTDQWVRRLERLAESVDVTVFWGLGDNEGTDPGALASLHRAARRASRLAIVQVDDTHAKVLVSDGYYIKTSFNWLSFRGDPTRKYRQEEGDLVQDQVLADRAYEKYMSESCARAIEVVGTLPAKYREAAGAAPESGAQTDDQVGGTLVTGVDLRVGQLVGGMVTEASSGGLVMDVGVRAFLPASLVEIGGVGDLEGYVGRELEAKIIEVNSSRNSVVVSRRAWLEQARDEARHGFLSQISVGQVLSGVVVNIVQFGAFVDLGGIDGLAHISELSWRHIDHPSEVVAVGDQLSVEVLEVDVARGRVSLSLKRTTPQ